MAALVARMAAGSIVPTASPSAGPPPLDTPVFTIYWNNLLIGALIGSVLVILNRVVGRYLIGGAGFIRGRPIAEYDAGELVATTCGFTRVVRVGQGPLVVCLHGFAGSAEVFREMSQWLVDAGHCVLMVDFFGHGHSDSPDIAYSAELFAGQLADVILAQAIAHPFDLVAHSMGGSVACRFAAVHPELVRRLVLVSPSIADKPLELRLRIALRIPILREVLASVIIPRLGEGVNWDNPGITRACWGLLKTRLFSGGSWNAGPAKSLENLACMRDKQDCVLVLWGALDRVVPFSEARAIAQVLPDARADCHSTADHMGFADGPDDMRAFFLQRVVDFVSSGGAGGGSTGGGSTGGGSTTKMLHPLSQVVEHGAVGDAYVALDTGPV